MIITTIKKEKLLKKKVVMNQNVQPFNNDSDNDDDYLRKSCPLHVLTPRYQ